jgi:hypothetical protein
MAGQRRGHGGDQRGDPQRAPQTSSQVGTSSAASKSLHAGSLCLISIRPVGVTGDSESNRDLILTDLE